VTHRYFTRGYFCCYTSLQSISWHVTDRRRVCD